MCQRVSITGMHFADLRITSYYHTVVLQPAQICPQHHVPILYRVTTIDDLVLDIVLASYVIAGSTPNTVL